MSGYFATMRVPLKRGRDFTSRDGYDAPFVTIVSEALARKVFPSSDARVPHSHVVGLTLD
jgi:hypothetical protein